MKAYFLIGLSFLAMPLFANLTGHWVGSVEAVSEDGIKIACKVDMNIQHKTDTFSYDGETDCTQKDEAWLLTYGNDYEIENGKLMIDGKAYGTITDSMADMSFDPVWATVLSVKGKELTYNEQLIMDTGKKWHLKGVIKKH